MFKLFKRKSKKEENSKVEIEKIEEKKEDNILELEDAMNYVQEKFLNSGTLPMDHRQRLQSFAMAGDKESRDIVKKEIKTIINENSIKVNGYTTEELVEVVLPIDMV